MRKFLVLLFACGLTLQAQTWTSVTSGLTGDIYGIDYADANNVWISASTGGVARSTNGGSTWIAAGNAGDGAYSIAAIDANTAVVALGPTSGNGSIMRTTNGGASWSQVYTAAGAWFNFVDNISSTLLWALSDPIGGNFHIVKSTDGGVTWALAPNLPTQPASTVFGANDSYYRIGNTCWFGTGGSATTSANRVYKSTNGPDGPWTFSTTSVAYPGALAFSSASSNGIAGFWSQTTLINRTTDGGSNWTPQTTAIGTVNGLDYVQSTSWAWAATSTGIYFTTNNGTSWTQDLPEINMYCVRFLGDCNYGLSGGAGGKLYKSTRTALIPVELTSFTASTTNGSIKLQWKTATEINNRIFEIERKAENTDYITIGFIEGQGTTTQAHEYSYVDNTIVPGNYTYRLKQIDYDGRFSYSGEVAIEFEISAPSVFELAQNYPNPFNPSTTIRYSLAQAGNVRLTVYNTLGQEVTTLLDEFKDSGNYEINFDAINLSSGVYLYKLEAPNFVQIKKMIVNK
jgi:hypothetical protein